VKWVTTVILNSKLVRMPSRDLKDFATQLPQQARISFRQLGIVSIPIEKIVGSVGRAHELDKRFRYRGRVITERYQQAAVNLEKGEPRQPIKVYKLKRLRALSEYYVLDGHHRLAAVIRQGNGEINAFVTEVQIHDPEN
jgi:hypothetical protein